MYENLSIANCYTNLNLNSLLGYHVLTGYDDSQEIQLAALLELFRNAWVLRADLA